MPLSTTTITRICKSLDLQLPLAEVWVDQKGRISINDKLVRVPDIQAVMKRRLEGNPLLIVSFKADSRVKYEVMNSIMEELKGINAVRVVFSSDMESSRR